jgi:hypothetical protein
VRWLELVSVTGSEPPDAGLAMTPAPVHHDDIEPDIGDPDAIHVPGAGGRKSQATLLLELVGDVEFFHTPDNAPYARFERDGHREIWPLGSKALRAWLARRFHQAEGRAPGGQAIRDAFDVLTGRALYDGAEHPVYVRVAGDDGGIYFDLGNGPGRRSGSQPVAGRSWLIHQCGFAGRRVSSACPHRRAVAASTSSVGS